MALSGIDVSRHQGTVDWAAVARVKDFAIIKLTDGTVYRHIGWGRENLPKVRAAGLVPGAYHFLRAGDGAAQARYYVGEVQQLGGFPGLLAVVDVETNVDDSFPTIATVRAFATEFRRLTDGHPLVVYTGGWFWRGYLGNPHGADLGPLWHSEYETTAAEVADGPELDGYGGWPGATFWQWTSSGTCPGVAGNCDLNLFYGDRQQLMALANTAVPPAPEPEDPEMLIIDCDGRPALILGVGGVKRIDPAQRGALRASGVPAKVVTTATSDALWSLREPQAVASVDVEALSVALAGKLDGLEADEVEAVVRGVFADAGTDG